MNARSFARRGMNNDAIRSRENQNAGVATNSNVVVIFKAETTQDNPATHFRRLCRVDQ